MAQARMLQKMLSQMLQDKASSLSISLVSKVEINYFEAQSSRRKGSE
jgi:hypothetical protein